MILSVLLGARTHACTLFHSHPLSVTAHSISNLTSNNRPPLSLLLPHASPPKPSHPQPPVVRACGIPSYRGTHTHSNIRDTRAAGLGFAPNCRNLNSPGPGISGCRSTPSTPRTQLRGLGASWPRNPIQAVSSILPRVNIGEAIWRESKRSRRILPTAWLFICTVHSRFFLF